MTQRPCKLNVSKAELNLPTATASSLPMLIQINGINLPVILVPVTIHSINKLVDIFQHSPLLPLYFCFRNLCCSQRDHFECNRTVFLLCLKVTNSFPVCKTKCNILTVTCYALYDLDSVYLSIFILSHSHPHQGGQLSDIFRILQCAKLLPNSPY